MLFSVYAQGRWRELDIVKGRVSGWRERVRFLYVRNGRLVFARTGNVLRALRASADGHCSSARRGPPLQINRQYKRKRRINNVLPCNHCCHVHDNKLGADNNLNKIQIRDPKRTDESQNFIKKDACIQCSISDSQNTETNVDGDLKSLKSSKKIEEKLIISDENEPVVKKRKLDLAKPSRKADEEKVNHDNKESVRFRRTHKERVDHNAPTNSNNKIRLRNLKKYENDTSSETSSTYQNSSDTSKRSIILGKSNLKKDKEKIQNQLIIEESSGDDFELKDTRPSKKQKVEDFLESLVPNKTKSKKMNRNIKANRGETFKELIISDSDVEILRKFLEVNSPLGDLYRFDDDEDYKKMLFYSINPLVDIERSPIIAQMLCERESSQESELTLEDFATSLGLRKVSSIKENIAKYKFRKREPLKRKKVDARSEADKENNRECFVRLISLNSLSLPERNPLTNAKTASLDSDNVNENSVDKNKFFKKKIVHLRPGKSYSRRSSSNLREYSSLEDQAIVSWLSSGSRASQVNGNQVWRELQDQYTKLTGKRRSWHSLRNRYLRYILPALGSLALPEALLQRLRASAATGLLKRKPSSQRNSIFHMPVVRGASSRIPRPPPSPDKIQENNVKEDEHEGRMLRTKSPEKKHHPPSSKIEVPSYSDLTRAFSARHKRSSITPVATPNGEKHTDKQGNEEGSVKTALSTNEINVSKTKSPLKLNNPTVESESRVRKTRLSDMNRQEPPAKVRRSDNSSIIDVSEKISAPKTRRLYNPNAVS